MVKWKKNTGYGYQSIKTKHYEITLENRPAYCDRGNFYAKVFTGNSESDYRLDQQDYWPRYYFSEERAKAEIEAWLVKRGELKVKELSK